jgi:hypothetical protein
MLRILGPVYRYQGETIDDAVVYIDDHCYDEATHEFPVQQLLANNAAIELVVFDNLGHDDVLAQYPHVYAPFHLAAEVELFRKQKIQYNWNNKTHCFNFMINKPRPGRIKLLEYIETHKLVNRRHSLPWQQSTYASIAVTDYRIGNEVVLDRGVRNGSYSNPETYQKLLQQSVFEPTCVSLITEPCYYEKESIISEKTVMAMYAGTIPIWAGGWRLPDVMRDLGFDIFDDLVDHSYSTKSEPEQRLFCALDSNRHLLENFELVSKFVMANQHRLAHNVSLLEQNCFLQKVQREIQRDSRVGNIAALWGLPTYN